MRLCLIMVLVLAACDTTGRVPDLGDPYHVMLRPSPASIVDGALNVGVRYSGGCEEHTFDLGFTVVGSGADVWLTHDANGDTCEANITEALTVRLPEAIGDGTIRLYITEVETVEVRRLTP